MQAIEISATVTTEDTLVLDHPLPKGSRGRVRLLVLFDDLPLSDADEAAWLREAGTSSAFAFLNDPAEDIYSREDGEAVVDAP